MKTEMLRLTLLLFLTLPLTVVAQVVNIPDPNLRAEIEYQLKKGRGEPITTDEMATVTYVHQESDGIKDLTGLEFAIYLDGAYLLNNSISDISPLTGLTELQYLDLDINSVSDISALAGLTNLIELCLVGNPITDISALAGLTNLEKLSLGSDSISDISALAGLTNLKKLLLGSDSISDISPLAELPHLEELSLGSDSLSDISPLAELINLTRLKLGGILGSDISPLARLTDLTELELGNNSISDISAVSSLTNLIVLVLENNRIEDLSPLMGLTNLTTLWLSDNSISDLSPLVANAGLGEGDTVSVEGNPLSTESINTHIPTLQARGVEVRFDALGANIFFAPVKFARVGQIFRLNVVLAESLLLSRWSFEIAYTPKILDYLDNEHSTAYVSCSSTSGSIGTGPTGGIGIEMSLSENCPNKAGEALVSILFEAKSPGTVDFSLQNVVMLDSHGQPLSNIKVQPHQIVVRPSYDLNGDGAVNILDLTLVGQHLGQAHPTADVNHDGTVNILDLVAVAQHFSQ